MSENLNNVLATVVIDGKKVIFSHLELYQEFNAHHTFKILPNHEVYERRWLDSPGQVFPLVGSNMKISLKHKVRDAAGNSGRQLWAYACLVYAGFLFAFKDEQVISLLDKAVSILEQDRKSGNPESAVMLLPALGYKAAYYNFIKRHDLAYQWFIKEVTTALELSNTFAAISACKNAIIVAESHSMKTQMMEFLYDSFNKFYSWSDEELRATEVYFIVAFYLQNNVRLTSGERNEIRDRMTLLFGEN